MGQGFFLGGGGERGGGKGRKAVIHRKRVFSRGEIPVLKEGHSKMRKRNSFSKRGAAVISSADLGFTGWVKRSRQTDYRKIGEKKIW